MINSEKEINVNLKDELYEQYDWFYKSFLEPIQTATDEFFTELFSLKLLSVSKNINILFQGDDYFVTKIRVDKEHDVFFRCSSDAIKVILDRVLGENIKFNISDITELEAKIISSFNDYLYNSVSKFLLPISASQKKRKNFDTIHLTFFIKDKESDLSGKLIVSVPQVLLAPQKAGSLGETFDVSHFKSSKIAVNLKVGTTKFLLKDLKNLEKEDLVIFENSDIHFMTLVYKDYKKEFRLSPNPGLMTSISNDDGGNNMTDNSLSQSLWDNIQVEMGAEFEKVKITLGELKNIEQGLVVDISSVYDNRISLKVENKVIAKGELVIVNDRYGVRIDEVFASEKIKAEEITQSVEEIAPIEEQSDVVPENVDDEFDYSDFDLDEQDI